MRRLAIPMVIAPVFIAGCAARPNKPLGTAGTLAELRNVRPDVQEVKVEQGLDQAMQHYRRFLEDAPETAMTPEAMHPRGSAGNAAWPDRGPVRPSPPARPDARSAAPPASPPSPTACWDARRSRR